jgi:hypothetical protein
MKLFFSKLLFLTPVAILSFEMGFALRDVFHGLYLASPLVFVAYFYSGAQQAVGGDLSGIFLISLGVCCSLYLAVPTIQKYLVFVPALYFLMMPFVIATAGCSGCERWRYQLKDAFSVLGLAGVVVFMLYARNCWKRSSPSFKAH